MPLRTLIRLVLFSIAVHAGTAFAGTETKELPTIKVGLTAEFGLTASTSAQAVERGLRLAIDEINRKGGLLGNRKLELVTRDDRSLPARAAANLREMLTYQDLVAVFGGKYSPVIIELTPLAQQLGIPLLATWSSADSITEPVSGKNYVFRLSLTDRWAISTMADYLQTRYKVRHIGVLVPNTAWGRSSVDALHAHKSRNNNYDITVQWYSWGEKTLLPQYQALLSEGAEGLLMVANELEGAVMVKEIAGLPVSQRLPIAAHWGITGGEFVKLTGPALKEVDLSVVQTFTFNDKESPRRRKVMEGAKLLFGLQNASEIQSQVGFAHAYDLMHILAMAIQRAGSTDRAAIRKALEELPSYNGLVHHYRRPFTRERHEALSSENVFMATFREDGTLLRVAGRP